MVITTEDETEVGSGIGLAIGQAEVIRAWVGKFTLIYYYSFGFATGFYDCWQFISYIEWVREDEW